MPVRVLFASAELPGQGGLSTASLSVFRRLRAEGIDVHYLTVLEPGEIGHDDLSNDPSVDLGDPHVAVCRLIESSDAPQPALRQLVAAIGPDIGVGFGFRATHSLKNAAPTLPTIFATGTCRQAQDFVTSKRARDVTALRDEFASGKLVPEIVHWREQEAVGQCDLILTHSALTLEMFSRFFPERRGKTYPRVIEFGDWICDDAAAWSHLARPFSERDIDVLFVANSWARQEKGYDLVREVAGLLDGLRIHVVGSVPTPLVSVTHTGFLSHAEALFDLFGRARCVVCPSYIDAAPGILHEASVMGANAIASTNCGNAHLCHPRLLANPLDAVTLASCIRLAITRKFDDGLNSLGSRTALNEFVSLLQAFSLPFLPLARP